MMEFYALIIIKRRDFLQIVGLAGCKLAGMWNETGRGILANTRGQ